MPRPVEMRDATPTPEPGVGVGSHAIGPIRDL